MNLQNSSLNKQKNSTQFDGSHSSESLTRYYTLTREFQEITEDQLVKLIKD